MDLVLLHGAQDLCNIRLCLDGDRHAIRQLARGDIRRVNAAGNALGDDVTVGDNATQAVVLPADRERTDIKVTHLLCGVLECLLFADARHADVHDVSRRRHHIPPESGRGTAPARAVSLLVVSGLGCRARLKTRTSQASATLLAALRPGQTHRSNTRELPPLGLLTR